MKVSLHFSISLHTYVTKYNSETRISADYLQMLQRRRQQLNNRWLIFFLIFTTFWKVFSAPNSRKVRRKIWFWAFKCLTETNHRFEKWMLGLLNILQSLHIPHGFDSRKRLVSFSKVNQEMKKFGNFAFWFD